MRTVAATPEGPEPEPEARSFGPFRLDRAAGRLLKDGQPLALPPKPWAVLVYLAERPGRLVGKDELLDAVWGHRHVTDSVLRVTINSLRSALGDDPASPRYIETAARRGYRFVAPVEVLGTKAHPAPVTPTARVPASAPAPSPNPGWHAPDGALTGHGNLPAATATLVGRDTAVADLRALLAAHRLVTVLGPGGVGKTQLALSAARLDPPPDGVWLVRLEGLADAGPLLDTVARTLSLGANASRSVQALAQALAPLSLRLVLDNAEHLVDALAPLVAQTLADAPGVQILVTSQIPLRVGGEGLLPLQPLTVPAEGEAADPARHTAVALFIERLRAQRPAYAPEAGELADIGALCRLLDGLPLALELAAARVPLLGTAGVLSRMSDRFALLSRGARDAPQRHRTLRQALEWSFGLLGEDERRVLRRLSVLAGSFTPAMAAVVAGNDGDAEWAVLDALQNLQDHSLLASDTAHAEPRLRQLESVRALAAEQLRDAGEEAATRTRLAEAMRDRFRAAQAQFTRTPLLHWLPPLRPEADNLRLAMAHVVGQVAAELAAEVAAEAAVATDAAPAAAADAASAPAPGTTPALRLAVDLFSHAILFWLRSGRKREALTWFEAIAPHAARIDEPALRAAHGLAVGALAAYGQSMPPAEAFPWLDEAEQVFTRLGDGRSAMLALYLHAALQQRIAPTGDRTPLLERMRALERPDWSARERNFAAWTAAVNAHGHGDLQAFRDFCADDLARARASDDQAEAWVAAFGLGQALWTLGERARAVDTLAEAVADLRASGLLREYATTAALAASMRLALTVQTDATDTAADGSINSTTDNTTDSTTALREAADVTRAEGMLWWMGDALMMLPARRGDWPAALRLQAWIDQRMAALGMKRSPVASSLREAFDTLLAEARRAPGWREPEPAATGPLDDAEVLRLSFG